MDESGWHIGGKGKGLRGDVGSGCSVSWQRRHGSLTLKSPLGWRRRDPAYLRSLRLTLENVHRSTGSRTHSHIHAQSPSAGLSVCWTWRPTQELAIEKGGLGFMCLTLPVRSIVKVISMEEEDLPLLFPLRAISLSLAVWGEHLVQRVIKCVNEAHILLVIDFHFM